MMEVMQEADIYLGCVHRLTLSPVFPRVVIAGIRGVNENSGGSPIHWAVMLDLLSTKNRVQLLRKMARSVW